MDKDSMNIGFIGLGKLGLPCALAINHAGHSVYGYDINPDIKTILETKKLPYREMYADEYLKTHSIKLGSIDEVVKNSDIIFVPIQTPHEKQYEGVTRIPKDRSDFNYDWLKIGISTLNDAIKNQDNEKVVIIISTVLPGTINREIMPIINGNSKFKLCYNPFFIAMGTTIEDFTNPEFVLFGVNDDSAAKVAESFYKTIHNRPFYKTSIINAELIKVSYNTFIGMKIVFSNTVMEMCHKLGADVDEVLNAIKIANFRLISPKYIGGGMGDGGGCHPRDNIAMSWLAKNLDLSHDFFEDIMLAREHQTEFLADLMLKHEGPYYILGTTFKEETNLILGSPSILLKNILIERGVEVIQYDPWVNNDVPKFERGTYIVTAKHKTFQTFAYPNGSVVIDVWRYLNLKNKELLHINVGKP